MNKTIAVALGICLGASGACQLETPMLEPGDLEGMSVSEASAILDNELVDYEELAPIEVLDGRTISTTTPDGLASGYFTCGLEMARTALACGVAIVVIGERVANGDWAGATARATTAGLPCLGETFKLLTCRANNGTSSCEAQNTTTASPYDDALFCYF